MNVSHNGNDYSFEAERYTTTETQAWLRYNFLIRQMETRELISNSELHRMRIEGISKWYRHMNTYEYMYVVRSFEIKSTKFGY